MENVRIWVSSDNLKKFEEQSLKEEEREAIIISSLEDSGWMRYN